MRTPKNQLSFLGALSPDPIRDRRILAEIRAASLTELWIQAGGRSDPHLTADFLDILLNQPTVSTTNAFFELIRRSLRPPPMPAEPSLVQ